MTFSPLKVCWCCKRLTGMGDIKKEKMSGGLKCFSRAKDLRGWRQELFCLGRRGDMEI